MKKTFNIDENAQGQSLRLFIKSKYSQYSSRAIEALLAQNGCRLNHKIERFGSKKLQRGDVVEIFPKNLKAEVKAELKILFEDDHFLAIDKPSGVPSMQKEIEKRLGKKVFLVHRLDKQTSGALLLAKTKEAKDRFEKLFFDREIKKEYVAVVHGKIKKSQGTVEAPLRLKKRYEGGVLYKTAPYGKEAITHWTKLMSSKDQSYLSLEPITGRTHQIRVHLQSIGHPILGDAQYGSENIFKYHAPRLMLHAKKISFKHPFLNKKIEIIAPVPIIIRQTLTKLFKKQK